VGSNTETVQALYEAFGKGDVPAILDRLAIDVRWEQWADNRAQAAGVPWMQARTGPGEVAEFFNIVGNFEVQEFSVVGLMEGGNQVVAEVVIEVTDRVSGAHYRDEELHLWTFDDRGKVTRLRHYTDTAKQIAAASRST
jgi:ketosteroid isomerase-like protein